MPSANTLAGLLYFANVDILTAREQSGNADIKLLQEYSIILI